MEDWLDPLYDAPTMRSADAWAIDEQGVPSLELMEEAGGRLADAVIGLAPQGPVRVVCGKGNNGGDGLVAARHLAAAGHRVEVLLLWPADELSPDASANLGRFDGETRVLKAGEARTALEGSAVVVDAVFGTGFSGAPRAPADAAIQAMNDSGAAIVAADIASGVDASTGEVAGAAVDATATVAFHAPKVGHRVAPGKRHCGELVVAPIGIPQGAPGDPPAGTINARVLSRLPTRSSDSTKFSSGQVLIAGGSRGLTGAVCMSALAACRAGAGYATAAVPASLEGIFEIKLTEVMSVGCEDEGGAFVKGAGEQIAKAAERAAAVVVGPGMGRGADISELVREVAAAVEAPLLIDADGLNALGEDVDVLADRPAPTVLTPHAGELARLMGSDSDAVGEHRLASAREIGERAAAVVVLKGDDTIVAAPGGRVAVNALSSPALATAGTGDVLSGMIAALLARGLEAPLAAAAAVYAHARAGRVAAARVGLPEAVVAGDVINAIPAGLGAADGP